MLHDTVDVDKMLQFDQSGDPLNNQNVLLDLDEQNYSSLRAHQRRHINQSIKQEQSVNLAQNN